MHEYLPERDCNCVECAASLRRIRQTLILAAFIGFWAAFYLLLLTDSFFGI